MTNTNENSSENEKLSHVEFLDLIPHLSLQDLLSTEYKVDNKWNLLIQLRDASKKIYQCAVCNVVQSGVKNLFAHVDGKKHKLKMSSIKQLYQAKYTYGKNVNELLFGSKTKSPPTKSQQSVNTKSYQNTSNNENFVKNAFFNLPDKAKSTLPKLDEGIKDNAVEIFDDINIQTSEYQAEETLAKRQFSKSLQNVLDDPVPIESKETQDKSEKCDVSSTVMVINDYKEDCYFVEEDKCNYRVESLDNIEPAAKKAKMVVNPAALSKKKGDAIIEALGHDDKKPKYQSNITIIPTKIKRSESLFNESEHGSQQLFTTKRFTCNPLDDAVHGLVGVEYVVKILKGSNGNQPKYECGLCEVLSDDMGMQNHLIGYNHRLKFCEKHFPTAIRQYRQYIRNVKPNEVFKVMTPILKRLAIAIEQHHGRDLPYECIENEFNMNRHEILSKVFSCRHASEQYGPTFTHIIDSKEVDKLIEEIDKYQPIAISPKTIAFDLGARPTPSKTQYTINRKQQSYSTNTNRLEAQSFNSSLHHYNTEILPLDNETHKLMVEKFLKNNCKQGHRSSKPANELRPTQTLSRSISPIGKLNSKRKSLSPLRKNDVWQAYRHLVDQKIRDLNEVFQIYRTDPETHPAYDREWQMFWKRRKNELIEAGLDHRAYNYQPEWVRFFNIRIEELYNQSVENIKIDARERLYLPMSNESTLHEKYHVHVNYSEKEKTTLSAKSLNEKWPRPDLKDTSNEYFKKPQVVSVLRLLTALEDYLGSLGPKIVDLLSKALQVEKNNPCGLDIIILTEENCSLLETAMEKFKGLIIANIFEDVKHQALRKAIDEVECLLSQTKRIKRLQSTSNCAETPKQKSDLSKENQLLTNILAQVDKKELALKLAGLLAAQGKTDIDPVQLQKIISVYMLIEQKKQETLTTSEGKSTDLRSQSNLRDHPLENNKQFPEPQFSSYGNPRTDRNFSGNLSNATFYSNESSNRNRNPAFSNNYQHRDSSLNFGYQQSIARPQEERMNNLFDWSTSTFHSSQGQTMRNIEWSGNNWNWRKC
ncbi:PREDICTED: uncharacterized protein CG7065 [Rhagoletis zephyria]|uniref:uncharacterized protein CG7065 n=1 Tax=Rhagoletis zephyria TaxID=28612 RepID=UPI000811A534|nr:PREDICTED: uncharacterized protein CG7065 [Rhagoletis zephyria]XP_036340237.1 uncharacterized protein CG7065 [Rhagoletis pomonella]XP_036340242.1 uncharacterized protein CG7065 [Rhagoletis pomonella]